MSDKQDFKVLLKAINSNKELLRMSKCGEMTNKNLQLVSGDLKGIIIEDGDRQYAVGRLLGEGSFA